MIKFKNYTCICCFKMHYQAILGATNHASNGHYMPRASHSIEKESDEVYSISNAIADLNSAEKNMDLGDLVMAGIRLKTVKDYFQQLGVLDHDTKMDSEPKYERILNQYIDLLDMYQDLIKAPSHIESPSQSLEKSLQTQ